MFVRCSNSSSDILAAAHPKRTQTVIDATRKETAIDQQQRSCETLVCQRHQTTLRLLSSAATASTRWRVRELYCSSTYVARPSLQYFSTFSNKGMILIKYFLNIKGLFWFSLQSLPEMFLVLRGNDQKNVYCSSRRVPVILLRFYWNLGFFK